LFTLPISHSDRLAVHDRNIVTPSNCAYRTPDGQECTRPARGSRPFCVLHCGSDRKPDEELPLNPQFDKAFADVIAAGDGDWRGFVFPHGTKFPKEIDFPVNAQWCTLGALGLHEVVFKHRVDFENSTATARLELRSVVFEDSVS